MRNNHKIYSLVLLPIFAAILFFGFFLELPLAGAQTAGQGSPSSTSFGVNFSYIAKLNSTDTSALQQVASNIHREFEFSKSAQFQNIYTFQSSLPLPILQKQLVGKSARNAVYVDYNQAITTEQLTVIQLPNDPGFSTDASNIDKQWGLVKAKFIEGWEKTKGNSATVVAVIDTGIDRTHEDIRATRFVDGYNVLTATKIAQYVNSDDNGHGTLVSGVIGAVTNNLTGISGANWSVTLMPIKALNTSGSGSSSSLSEGIVWAADHGANVINLSLGGIGFSHDTTLANAISYAFDKDVVIVAAAGNDVAITGGNLDVEPVFPICNDNGKNMVIGVTATDVNDQKPSFANFGKACVDVAAPGKRILSTINHDPATGLDSPDSYAYASGTSLATPYVSAQAALLKSLYPLASNRQIRDRIISTADNIDNVNFNQCANKSCKGLMGSGRINVAKSLQEAIISIIDGDVVQVIGTSDWYYINGGKRQLISPFVKSQRFTNLSPKQVTLSEIDRFPEGSFAEPIDGTLVKTPDNGTVYYMSKGLRLPVTYQIFLLRNFDFKNVFTLSPAEVNSWVTGSFLTPPEGTLVRTGKNPTVYWVVGEILHPINYKFYTDRGLQIFPVVYISDNDISKLPTGESYILD